MLRKLTFIVDNLNGIAKTRIINITNFKQSTIFKWLKESVKYMKIQVTADLLDGLVLALLNREDYYGYALTQEMQKAISISKSTMYPVLRRLKKEGYLTTYDQPFQGRNRRYYQITSDGEQHLEQVYKMWTDYKESLDQVFIPDKEHDLTHKNDIEA